MTRLTTIESGLVIVASFVAGASLSSYLRWGIYGLGYDLGPIFILITALAIPLMAFGLGCIIGAHGGPPPKQS